MRRQLNFVFLILTLILSLVAWPSAGKGIIVDGYDLTASLSGIPLKEIYKEHFKIGVGLNGYNTQTDTVNSKAMREVIKYHFNSVTYTNLMKPDHILDQAGSINNYQSGNPEPAVQFNSVIKGLNFCQDNGIKMRGHVLVWHTQTPDWFFREGYTNTSPYVKREIMLARLESYIRQVLKFVQAEYPGVVYSWDVVNEAVENSKGQYELESGFNIRTKHGDNKDNLWYKIIGVDYVEKSFEYARKYAEPEVKLFYNDYNTFQPTKTQSIYKLASHLKNKGLIDGIGMQGYMSLDYPGLEGGGDSFKTALSKFAELGLEIHITELSINTEGSSEELFEKQAMRYGELFRVLTEMKTSSTQPANITSVTVFGIMDNYLFYSDDTQTTRLFDGKFQPKPAFYGVIDPNKPWYITKARYEGALQFFSGSGEVLVKLLPGEYLITELRDLGLEWNGVKEFKLSEGYLMEVITTPDAHNKTQIYVGNTRWAFKYSHFENADRIIIKEDNTKNLLLNKPVLASHLPERAERAIDGVLLTSWNPNEEPPYWISVDLQKPCVITRWVVYHRGGGGFAPDSADGPLNTADFRLQVSDDEVIWKDIDLVENNIARITDRIINPVETRYLRLLITKPSSFEFSKDLVIYDWEVYGLVVE